MGVVSVMALMPAIIKLRRHAIKAAERSEPSLICRKPSCHRMRPLWSENRLSTATTTTIASNGAIDDRTRRNGTRDTV